MSIYQSKKKTHLKRFIKAKNIYVGLVYPVNQINRTFKLKIYGLDSDNKRLNKLVGVAGFIRLVDDMKLANRLLTKAFKSKDDKIVYNLRRGLKITFYNY